MCDKKAKAENVLKIVQPPDKNNRIIKEMVADFAKDSDDYTAIVCFGKRSDGTWVNFRSPNLSTHESVGILEGMKFEILNNVDTISGDTYE